MWHDGVGKVIKAFVTVTLHWHQPALNFSFLFKFGMSVIIVNNNNSYFIKDMQSERKLLGIFCTLSH